MEKISGKVMDKETNTDFEIRSLDALCINESEIINPWYHDIRYFLIGIFFGIILVKVEIVSWFRIQEMFRLESFHMYGVIGSAVVVGTVSVQVIKKFKMKTLYGEPIIFHRRQFNKGQIFGGILFGLGWAVTGACPGPLFAQIGAGFTVAVISLCSAIAGTWVYGVLREKLPH